MTNSQRVAVIRLDALGDTLLSTPAVDVLCRELGAENVLILTSPGLGVIFGERPRHKEIALEAGEEEIAQAIDDFGAQTVYVFSEKRRALRGAYQSRAKQRIGFDPGWTQPLRSFEIRRYLSVRFPIVNTLDSSSRYHEVERYCRLVGRGLNKKSVNGGRLRFFTVERPNDSISQAGPVGFQWAKKWLNDGWPEELLPKLVEALPSDIRIFVAPGEKSHAEGLLGSERCQALVSSSDLTEYAREIGKCRYLISIDTGAVHVAASMGVPVVDVFPEPGSHHTVPRWRPWMTPHRVVLKPKYEERNNLSSLVDRVTQSALELEEILDGLLASTN